MCSCILGWNTVTSTSRQQNSQQIAAQAQQLEQQYATYQAYAAQEQQRQYNRQQINSILRFLQQLKSTPESIILDELFFAPDKTISLKGTAGKDQDLERFGKILQKYSRKTSLLSSSKNTGGTVFEYIIPPATKPTTKGKNNGDY